MLRWLLGFECHLLFRRPGPSLEVGGGQGGIGLCLSGGHLGPWANETSRRDRGPHLWAPPALGDDCLPEVSPDGGHQLWTRAASPRPSSLPLGATSFRRPAARPCARPERSHRKVGQPNTGSLSAHAPSKVMELAWLADAGKPGPNYPGSMVAILHCSRDIRPEATAAESDHRFVGEYLVAVSAALLGSAFRQTQDFEILQSA